MPTFIDESGDTGHGKGSKPYFRLAAVWLPTLDHAECFREKVRCLRGSLGRKKDYEFKFATTHDFSAGRTAFLELACQFPFCFSVCAIDKTVPHWNNAAAHEQHWAAATAIAVDLRRIYHASETSARPLREKIIVDKNDDQNFLDVIHEAFKGLRSRHHPNSPRSSRRSFGNRTPMKSCSLWI